jgi:gliding motility-associated-like protein
MNAKLLFTIILSFTLGVCSAQNIVPNGGFEEYNSCPTNWAQLVYSPGYNNFPSVKNWVSPLENTTPDYYNTCATISSKVNIPFTFLGYHTTNHGDGCAGIIAYYNSNVDGEYREYIQTRLNAPMIAGHTHEVTFYVSTNYDPTISSYNYIGIDRVGANFTQNQVSISPDKFLMLDYSIANPANNFITSTTDWVKVQGTYIAQGGEEWMTIGTFKTSAAPFNKVQVYPAVPTPGTEDYCYLYIDDVSVTDLDKIYTFTSSHDTAVCDANGMILTSPVVTNSYLWNTGDTTASITLSDSGLYWCLAKSGNNEYIDTFHVNRMYLTPSFSLGPDTLICKEDGFTLGKPIPGATYYAWNTGSNSCCISPAEDGRYFQTISNGCDVRSDTCEVRIVACENCFWAPNAFTPNADSKNDRFGVKQSCLISKGTLRIFDRWGAEIFTTTDLTQKWDGTYNGSNVTIGTYSYMIEYWLLANKPKQIFKGTLLLIR